MPAHIYVSVVAEVLNVKLNHSGSIKTAVSSCLDVPISLTKNTAFSLLEYNFHFITQQKALNSKVTRMEFKSGFFFNLRYT